MLRLITIQRPLICAANCANCCISTHAQPAASAPTQLAVFILSCRRVVLGAISRTSCLGFTRKLHPHSHTHTHRTPSSLLGSKQASHTHTIHTHHTHTAHPAHASDPGKTYTHTHIITPIYLSHTHTAHPPNASHPHTYHTPHISHANLPSTHFTPTRLPHLTHLTVTHLTPIHITPTQITPTHLTPVHLTHLTLTDAHHCPLVQGELSYKSVCLFL